MAKEYECYLTEQMDNLDRKQTRLEFRNSKRQLLFVKDFENTEEHAVKEVFDDVYGIYDQNG